MRKNHHSLSVHHPLYLLLSSRPISRHRKEEKMKRFFPDNYLQVGRQSRPSKQQADPVRLLRQDSGQARRVHSSFPSGLPGLVAWPSSATGTGEKGGQCLSQASLPAAGVGEPRRAPEGPCHGQHGFGSFCRNKRTSSYGGETPECSENENDVLNDEFFLLEAPGEHSAAGPKPRHLKKHHITPRQSLSNTPISHN